VIGSHHLRAQQRNRLSSGGRIDRTAPLHFTYAGRRMQGYAGDTLASALLANGVDVIGRSFKYGRPRGIMTAGVEEPNAILQLGHHPATTVPNIRATEQSLHEGLSAGPVNGWPSADNDVMGVVGKVAGNLMTPGFYYKTFMFPKSRWETYERFIRKAAGLGRAPTAVDPDAYDHVNAHADVLVVGAGPAGLAAALAASKGGARVMLADEREEFGGSLLHGDEYVDGQGAMDWVSGVVAELEADPNVTLLRRSTVNGYHDHGFLTIRERLTDHLPVRGGQTAGEYRQRLHRVRAAAVVLASGAHERPLVFANNDVPGCMTASSVSHYIRRFAVVPGQRLVVATANDGGYRAAFDWLEAGRDVVAVVDARREPDGTAFEEAQRRGIRVMTGCVVVEARSGRWGSNRVSGALVAPVDAAAAFVIGDTSLLACDTIASSGGWSPAVHLSCHTGSRPVWNAAALGFVPGETIENCFPGGSVVGEHALGGCLASGIRAAGDALLAAGVGGEGSVTALPDSPPTSSDNETVAPPMALFLAPHPKPASRAPKQFVDFQNDVTAGAIEMTVREGFESIEHVKRYTALGFGTDQGKTANVNGLAIVARALGRDIPEVGTTVFRPNYTPVSFGVVAGPHVGELFDPERYTPMQAWHEAAGATFENVGQWKRPWFYPRKGGSGPDGFETMAEAIAREQLATRNGVGILDASTLGKIDVQGPDSREFLDRVYTNAWSKLAPGRCRYGLMCTEDGMVFDDGVTACLAEHHFHMTTTSGGAARVLGWLELWLETEWPDLDVRVTSVTDQWATMAVAGPKARALLAPLTDIDLSAEAFRFMDWKSGTVAGVPARVFRISFTGDLSYEVNVPAHYGAHVWRALFAEGEQHDLTPYGTETMHVLRAEKGFVIVGQDTDGSLTPHDMDHGWAVSENKPFSFLGHRGMQRADCLRSGRKQLVGLETVDPTVVLPEGAQAVADPEQAIPMTMIGHVTSSYHSAFLGRSIAMGVIRDGVSRQGDRVFFPLADGRTVEATIRATVWLDPDNARQGA